ncbi:serine/threonine-protein kinase [Streptomyces sp. NPDC001828]|uniref:serine/threonine-protein kinase n=1 Tax=Streptomyces sp. NPDC001828 TaxID=3364615 RepID=UPI0036C4FD1E
MDRTQPLQPADPERIGGYRLLARLGAGGMGQVYLARSDRARTVAVKLVRPDLADQDDFRARFRQEVLAARSVGGQWTAPVLDADTDAPVPWVATGYVAGPDLQSVVEDHGPLPEDSVRVLAHGLARALQDIHAAGLVHRDLKPSNVLVTVDGPRVIDFGVARALETSTDGGLTRAGALIGSPGFMAPEQIRGDRVTPACDVFCLGSVLAYAASGRLPFGEATSGVHALMFRIAQEPPDLDGVPESLQELIGDCLHKDPAARPTLGRVLERLPATTPHPWLPTPVVAQLASEAAKLLDLENPGPPTPPPHDQYGKHDQHDRRGRHDRHDWHDRHYTPTYSPYAPEPDPEPPLRRSAKTTAALIAVALVVAVGAGGSVYAFMRGGPQKPPPKATPTATPDSGAPSDSRTPDVVPQQYIGSWSAVIASNSGDNQRHLVIRPGRVGDPVLTLTADGSGYHCVFQARLAEPPDSSDAPLKIGPTEVAPGSTGTCDPGKPSTVSVMPDGRLHRQTVGAPEFLDYTKSSG